ncbi:MAG TPA: DUF2723 domain-containing protein [Thermoanaerobaculia bacterium]|nr:DUF2723 domain-containing protein [Thermoanaerobaculia bacterium]
MPESRLRIAIAASVFAIALIVYLATLGSVPGFVDSGTLTVAAWSLGNADPPGVPLYLLFTKLVMLLPVGSVALRANLASAIPAALAAALLSLAVAELVAARRREALAAAMLVSGLLFAFSRTLWGYATVAEVYALHFCLMMALAVLLLAWRRTENDALLYAAGAVFGASLAVHHVTAVLMAAGFAALVIGTLRTDVFRSRALFISIAIAILTATALYTYLPLRASAHPFWNWGDPDTPARFWRHITGAEHRQYFTSTEWATQFRDYSHHLPVEFAPPRLSVALLLALAGALLLFRRQRVLFWFVALIVAADALWVSVYPIANDREAYLLPTFIAIAICCGVGTAWLADLPRSRMMRHVFIAILLLVPVIAFAANLPYRGRNRVRVVDEYVSNATRAMRPNALLLTNDTNLFGPLLYLHEVERVRPDVRIVETGLLIRRWYVDSLVRRYPDLMRRVQKELDVYRPLVARHEAEPDTWKKDNLFRMSFNEALDHLILAMIARHGNAYVSYDLTLSGPGGADLAQRIEVSYDLMPRGTLFEVMPGNFLRPPDATPIETKAILDPSTRYTDDDVVPKEIRPVYRAVFMLRGQHLAALREYDKSIAEYERALRFDPASYVVQNELTRLRGLRDAPPQ